MQKLKAHREGKLIVLCNCAVLTEGYDDWRIGCIVLARPTKSQLTLVQMAGRGTRIPEGINNLNEARDHGLQIAKDNCLLLDVVDNTTRHSLVTLSSLFGLNPRLDMKSKPITKVLDDLHAVDIANPGIDLSKLEDFDKLKSYVEEVNLFTVSFAPEVMDNSKFQWFKMGEDLYKLRLPGSEEVVVQKNLLDKWGVEGTVKGNHFKDDTFTNLHDAFTHADNMVALLGHEFLTLLRREAKWHSDPATGPQWRMMQRLGIHPPPGISKGNAQRLISRKLHTSPLKHKENRYGSTPIRCEI